MRPPNKSKESLRDIKRRKRDTRRRTNQFRAKNRRIKVAPKTVQTKNVLRCSLLNVDGLGESSLSNVVKVMESEKPDVVILLETKRRVEESGLDIVVPGYVLHESRRSNNAEDREGGGLAVYTRMGDGILFKEYKPVIHDQSRAFVNSERMWITVESQSSKTAICGLYLGCQYGDDRHGEWNNAIYETIQTEAFALRSRGYRVVFMGDFNGHVGSDPRSGGIPGNTASVNANGQRLLDFITITDSVNINSMCRLPGSWDTRVCEGLWTRQRSGFSSVIDYALISREHANSVVSMYIDDRGALGGGSDHNWIMLDISDKFVAKKRATKPAVAKERWNITEDQDWSSFKAHMSAAALLIEDGDVDTLASNITSKILKSLHETVGLKKPNPFKKPRLLPPTIVAEINIRDQLEKNWKSLNSKYPNLGSQQVAEAENLFNVQHAKVADMLHSFRSVKRSLILKQCSGPSMKARRNFWSHVSPSKKQSADISAVVDPISGAVKCDLDEIKSSVEDHLLKVYKGSYEKIPPVISAPVPVHNDHAYTEVRQSVPGVAPDHNYSVDPSPTLPAVDSSDTLDSNPGAWINREISTDEVATILKELKNSKAYGWDKIPNEALKNLPVCMIQKIASLFNKIKSAGIMPKGWNRGRVTLVHKRGLRELLGNYRPITVLVSLSGLFSKLLNARLIKVTEKHKLLGEIQNGFRKGRCGADNNFVLDTILWKYRAMGRPVHMSFIDISKAYDSVNREILWKKLSSLGFSGDFLSALKALYTDDSVDCVVNGITTRPVFLRRGLRQGCALSPILFALYIMDVGNDINISKLGFKLGNVIVSGLLFADDLVLVTRSSASLKTLLALVKKGFDRLKLTISVEKSQVISPADDTWEVVDEAGLVVLTLDQVEQYKYLGTWTFSTMFKTSLEKQRMSVKTAHKYKSSCIHVSKLGPDVVDVVLTTWSNVAIPAILVGCEMIPFCETRIIEIERIQSQIAKFALGISRNCPNICAQTELGLKPFRQVLYEHQLKFYFRALFISEDRWVHQALMDHLSGDWFSPYLQHISMIRGKMDICTPIPAPSLLKNLFREHFIAQINCSISAYDWILPIKALSKAAYVCENEYSSVIAEFKLDCANLGNKQPRSGHVPQPFCPVCPVNVPNSGIHLLFSCGSVSALRQETGIQSFITQCLHRGFSLKDCYRYFVNGLNCNGKPVSKQDYLERGKCMRDMRDLWLSKW